MSLVGNLEDLGLGEILQILSLSGKSGVLRLETKAGHGQVLFQRGLIRSARLREGPADLVALLERAGRVEGAALESLREQVRSGVPADRAVLAAGILDEEALDQLRREHIENTVLAMFGWRSGEFSFVLDDAAAGRLERGGLPLTPGLNAQFLALEGTRLSDEAEEEAAASAAALPAGADDSAASDGGEDELESLPEAEVLDPEAADEAPVLDAVPVPAAARPAAERVDRPIVAVDPELAMLEWIKGALESLQTRVHVFQRSEQAIHRIRQYVMRSEPPLVLLTTETPRDPVSGAANWAEISGRLRAQVPQLGVVLLADPDTAALQPGPGAEPDARSEKPRPTTLFDPRASEARAALAERLREAVRSAVCSRDEPA